MAVAAVAHAPVERLDRPTPVVVALIAATGAAAAAAASWLTLEGDEGRARLVHGGLVGWITLSYVVCGLIAWWCRPQSRLGPLMVAVAFGPLLARLEFADANVLHAIGESLQLLPPVLFLHVFLAYPDGRLERRFDRRLVAAAYCGALGFGPLTAAVNGRTHDVVLGVHRLGISVLALAALSSLLARRRSEGRRLRHSRDLRIACYVLALALLAVGIVLKAFSLTGLEPIRAVAFALVGLAPVVFLGGLLRARLARTSVGDLLVELGADPAAVDVEAALARALRDPSVELVYWLPEFGVYADGDGRAVELPAEGSGRSFSPIDRDGRRVAALVHDASLDEERALVDAVGAAAGIALENARLHVELKARLDELRGSRARIVAEGQRERQRLERNLHDGAQQRLIALSLELSLLEEELPRTDETTRRMTLARREIALSLEELRDVARGLHPAVVSGHGLGVALEQLAARAPVPVRLTIELGVRLPEALEVAAYYLVSESLANVGKYAEASTASVDVALRAETLVVEVADDGIGGADTERGSGLRGLADRVETLGGRLRVWSPAGAGTRVRAEIPCVP
jgi:signal transduction histidine kinase